MRKDGWVPLSVSFTPETAGACTVAVVGTGGSGNPTSYYNGRDYTFQWEQGRQLSYYRRIICIGLGSD